MKGLLLVTHGTLCQGMYDSCQMITGYQENVHTLSLGEEGVELFRYQLEEIMMKMETLYENVIIVTDILNATPYNECCRYILSHKSTAKLLSGMNLAMVIELVILLESDLSIDDLCHQALESAKLSLAKFEKK